MFLEIRYIIALFVLITVAWLCAGFHLAYGNEWILVIFMVFDGILVRTFLQQYIHLHDFVQLWSRVIVHRQNDRDFTQK